jgi:ketol-acid reductoisomerase
MTVIYHEEDADLADLTGKTVTVVGYGNMGRPMALNLRDSGIRVLVSEPRTERMNIAQQDGFIPLPIPDAVRAADIILLLLRDEDMPATYLHEISPVLRRGQCLLFSSAYNIAFGFIEAPSFVDVGLVSARTLGLAVRERYLSGEGFASFVAVAQDATRMAWRNVLAVAKAIGALRGGAVEIRFETEAELDLFFQQTLLPIMHHALMTAVSLLMRMGYPPEAVFTELYLSGETADYLRQASQVGLTEALKRQSMPAQYGALSRADKFTDPRTERMMEQIMNDIRAGKFTQEWAREAAGDYPRLRQLLRQTENLDLWELEQQTLELLRRGR